MIGFVIAKVADVATDLLKWLVTQPLGWLVLGVLVVLHITGTYTADQFISDVLTVFWYTTFEPLLSWIVSTVEQFIQNALNPL